MTGPNPAPNQPHDLAMPFVAHESRVKLLLGLLGCLVFVGGSALLFRRTEPETVLIAVAGIAFFGPLSVLFLVRLLRPRRAALVFDTAGFTDRRVCHDPIPWDQVLAADTVTIQRSRFISVELADPTRFRRTRLARLNTAAGFRSLNIGLGFLDRPGDDIQAAFFFRLDTYAPPTSQQPP